MTWDQVQLEFGDDADDETKAARRLIQINKLREFARTIGKTPAELKGAGGVQVAQWTFEHTGRRASAKVLDELMREAEFNV